jgi:hypothetical protein
MHDIEKGLAHVHEVTMSQKRLGLKETITDFRCSVILKSRQCDLSAELLPWKKVHIFRWTA